MVAVVAVLTGTSVLLISLATASRIEERRHAVLRLSQDHGSWRKRLTRMGRSRLAQRIPHRLLRQRVNVVGDDYGVEFLLGLKMTFAVGAVAVLAFAAIVFPPFLFAVPAGALAAFQLPDIALARRAKKRKVLMADQVPELADLLLVMTEAGLSPAIAFRRAAEVLPEPLGEELNEVIRRLDLGVPWRTAMAQVAERAGVSPLKRLARALTRSQRLGTSLGSVLRTMAEDLRDERRTEAELASRQAPVKMLFPLVFLILPAFLLLTVGPVVLSTIRSLQ